MEKQKKESAIEHQAVVHRCVKKDELSLNVLSEKASITSFSSIIRSLQQGWRQGTVGVKTRAEVSRTNKKPWKQKGTGRARAGSARSPLWRGGGVTFGPQPRVAEKKVLKSAKKQVFASLVSHKIEKEAVVVVNWQLQGNKPKTKDVATLLSSIGSQNKKVIFFMSENDYLLAASCANLPNVYALAFDQPNAYSLALGKQWIILEKDLDLFKEMVAQWN